VTDGQFRIADRAERDACGIGFVARADGEVRADVVAQALEALARMRHRGAVAADGISGDGAGLLLPIPRALLAAEMPHLSRSELDRAGLLQVFVRGDGAGLDELLAEACGAAGVRVLAMRDVPVDPAALGDSARRSMPSIRQAIVRPPIGREGWRAERSAFRARRHVEATARRRGLDLYVASCSFRTVTYKALVTADRLCAFFPDLRHDAIAAPFAIVHQRFSTNTEPSWERAQPFRMSCHNGEINSIDANVAWMRAREDRLGVESPSIERLLRPIVDVSGSDSSILDEVADLLTHEGPHGGRDARQVLATLVPAAWEDDPDLDPIVRGFYRYAASTVEPWDGPAAICFTDGIGVGATLDRNGLRPLRYAIRDDGLVVCASEAGVVDLDGERAVRRGMVGPGRMVWVDPRDGGVDLDAVGTVAARRPFGAWAAAHRVERTLGHPSAIAPREDLERHQVAHAVSRDDVRIVLRHGVGNGREPLFSMGDDTPLAVLSAHDRPVHHFLRQRFAQVTNPAIDHVRERSVTSVVTLLGPRDALLWERPEAAALLEFPSFLAFEAPLGARVALSWPVSAGPRGLETALRRIADEVVRAVDEGASTLILTHEVDPATAPVPSVLATGAAHHALIEAGVRTKASIVVRGDDLAEAHAVACALTTGADLVVPTLAWETAASLAEPGEAGTAVRNVHRSLEEGVRTTMAKLGIATVDSYRGSHAFDVLGLTDEVAERCFGGMPTAVGGLTFADLGARILARHGRAFGEGAAVLANPGLVRFRRGGEYHAANPDVVRSLHRVADPELKTLRSTAAADGAKADLEAAHALRAAVRDGDGGDHYARFVELIASRPASALRDLLELRTVRAPISLDQVEAASAICARFSSAAISHGSISSEAHETLALAMRLVGGRANSGEGGEDPSRFGTDRNCAIKQVASARFGVTPAYLAHAEELQIKVAQGSKPGEGGHLPAHKVTDEIARLRHTAPGIALISPAPHHDVYSIEDLAQLISDLRQVNPRAAVSVKLVASRGVGTVAAGVAKASADVIHLSGADGGTGASPLGSIKHAGLPWELGLAETHGALHAQGLRNRVRLRVDGGIKTGRDVVLAVLLGADEVSFGTAALIAEGCLMVRSCHLDTCPVGIATQRPELRARFAATPEMVARYLTHVAEEVRASLASLGLRSLDEARGRTDLLAARGAGDDPGPAVDLSAVLAPPHAASPRERPPRRRERLGDRVHADAWPSIVAGDAVELSYEIRNTDRTVGGRLGGAIGRRFGEAHPPGYAQVAFRGVAGQSFGAFLAAGVGFRLVGEANDYVGKGMGGGRIVIVPPPGDAGDPTLVGNTVLYGATGGRLFVAGRGGQRFAVRNAGATAVVEGAGDHCCEYMTGGTVVVLGPIGRNAGAGMTGGTAFVLDPDGRLERRIHRDDVELDVMDDAAASVLRELLVEHSILTGSAVARRILSHPDDVLPFRMVRPRAAERRPLPARSLSA
jgi:glutamate synthase (ferredoxin)